MAFEDYKEGFLKDYEGRLGQIKRAIQDYAPRVPDGQPVAPFAWWIRRLERMIEEAEDIDKAAEKWLETGKKGVKVV